VFNVGPLELLVVLIIALIVLGPQRLPEVARSVGRGMREFRAALERDDEDDHEPEHDHEHIVEAHDPAGIPAETPPEAAYQKEADSSEPSSSSSGRV